MSFSSPTKTSFKKASHIGVVVVFSVFISRAPFDLMGSVYSRAIFMSSKISQGNIGLRIRTVRKGAALKQKEFARALGISQGFISEVEKGIKVPSDPLVLAIVHRYGVDERWLRTGEGVAMPDVEKAIKLINLRTHPGLTEAELADNLTLTAGTDEGAKKKGFKTEPITSGIPVLARVPAGPPAELSPDVERISVPGVEVDTYAVIVNGDSMSPGIIDGDYALFVYTNNIESGDIVVANNEYGEAMIKRYRLKGDEKLLTSDNPNYPTITPTEDFRIIGKVIKVWRDVKI